MACLFALMQPQRCCCRFLSLHLLLGVHWRVPAAASDAALPRTCLLGMTLLALVHMWG